MLSVEVVEEYLHHGKAGVVRHCLRDSRSHFGPDAICADDQAVDNGVDGGIDELDVAFARDICDAMVPPGKIYECPSVLRA